MCAGKPQVKIGLQSRAQNMNVCRKVVEEVSSQMRMKYSLDINLLT